MKQLGMRVEEEFQVGVNVELVGLDWDERNEESWGGSMELIIY